MTLGIKLLFESKMLALSSASKSKAANAAQWPQCGSNILCGE